jgi:beta-lactam-binding protein with PASTA domain
VPAVLGLRYEDADARLKAIGLKASLGESRVSASVPQSTVLAQHPVAGLDAMRGSIVVLDVSAGQKRATVPSLVGQVQADAESALRAAALAVGQVSEQASDQPRGTVLKLHPDAGEVLPAGTNVDLVLSGGPAMLSLPDVVGRELNEAKIMLGQLGVPVAPVEYDSSSNLPRGAIIAQSPAAGSILPPGTSLVLRVAGKP